eukprot:TRINITY_DN62931_c0_g1_i1.p1 TRINITY_DN62931_c0_g1~~TRINITY_DN62931_c0_g1_i1.p1  ORF type:complete len:540 (+),score=106.58 TRINITY_DN62931_c0_g1_i1:152-1771(+)
MAAAALVRAIAACALAPVVFAASRWPSGEDGGMVLLQVGAFSTSSKRTEEAGSLQISIREKAGERYNVTRIARASRADWKSGQLNLVFVHIPKNGGTAIEEAGAHSKVWWPRKWLSFWHGISMPDQSDCEKYHVPPEILYQYNEPDHVVFQEQDTFCVTRHPYSRILSEYKYMLEVKWGPSMSERYGTGLLEKPRCSAEGLNNFAIKAMQQVLKGKRYVHDCHLVPQADFVFGKENRRWCKNILRSSNLTKEFNDLMMRYGHPDTQLKESLINNSTTLCGNLSIKSFSREALRLMDEVYVDDFEKLNYARAEKPITFVQIPRNAGAYVSAALLKRNMKVIGHDTEKSSRRVPMPDYSWCEPYHVPEEFQQPDQVRHLFSSEGFCIVRNPYERALYEYFEAVQTPDYGKMATYYGIPLPAVGEAACDEEALNTFLAETFKRVVAGQRFLLDCRFLPQADYVWSKKDGRQLCTNMLEYNTLPKSFNSLMNEKGYSHVTLDNFPVNATPACPDLTVNSISDSNKELIQTAFAEDFSRLGYAK